MSSRCVMSAFAFIAVLGLVGPGASARAQTGGCTAFPSELTRVEGEPGAISLSIGLSNTTGGTVVFTVTTQPSAFDPGGSFTRTAGPAWA